MKTEDSYFRGFPAIWNVVIFYLFILRPSAEISLAVVSLFCIMTFVPVLFLHPLRVKRFRAANITLLALWVAFAAYALYCDLSPPPAAAILFLAIGLCFVAAGLLRTRSS